MAVLIGSLGSVGMWSVVVALPTVQAEFAASRGTASLAFTLMMLGFGIGGVVTGKITDRYGIVAAIGFGVGILGLGYIGAGLSLSIWQFILLHFAIGIGASATFGPLMAEASHWFDRYRGLGVAIAASRQLSRRHDLAVGHELRHAVGRLAHHPYRGRHLHHGCDDAGARFVAVVDRRRHATQLTSTRRRPGSICGSRPMR